MKAATKVEVTTMIIMMMMLLRTMIINQNFANDQL